MRKGVCIAGSEKAFTFFLNMIEAPVDDEFEDIEWDGEELNLQTRSFACDSY